MCSLFSMVSNGTSALAMASSMVDRVRRSSSLKDGLPERSRRTTTVFRK